MAISEVDSGRREDCFGFKKNLGPLHMAKSFGVSNFSDNWSKMKKTGKGLQKLGSKLEAFIGLPTESLLNSFEVGFSVCLTEIGWVKTNESVLVSSKRVGYDNEVGILTPDLDYEERR